MGIMVYSFLWAMQDLYHQQQYILWPERRPYVGTVWPKSILHGCTGYEEGSMMRFLEV